jgi:hypothetical protein
MSDGDRVRHGRRVAQGSQDTSGEGQGVRVLGRLLAGEPPKPGLDWEELAMLARQHKVSPLLFWQLRVQTGSPGLAEGYDPGETGIPVEAWHDLVEDFYLAAARSMRSEAQLAQVLRSLEAEGVTAMVIKGAALGAVYPDPALRPYVDLDLLVPEDQLARAESALNRLGYRASTSKGWSMEHHRHLPTMMATDDQSPVEIHWRLDNPGQVGHLPTPEMWGRAVPLSVGGQAALQLDPIDAALHVCCHAVVQNIGRLGLQPVCDLVQLAESWDRAQWEALACRAKRYGLARAVFFMLFLAREAMELAVPADVTDELASAGGVMAYDGQIERFLTLEQRPRPLPATALRALAQKGLSARVIYMVRSVFPSRASMAALYKVPIDSPRVWVAYVRRPLDLLLRHGRAVWHVLRGDPAAQEAWEREAWLERWLRQEAE